MSKRKPEDELSRFVWKRNPQYDITLLGQVEAYNPFAFKNQKPWWEEIAETIRELDSRMKVTDRNCRERTMELLRSHRRNELASIRSSGTSAAQLTKLQLLLTNIAKMEEAKPSKTLQKLYSKSDKDEAEEERSRVVEAISDSSEEEDPDEFDCEDDMKKKKKNQKKNQKGSEKYDPKKQLVKHLESKSEKELTVRKEELEMRKEELRVREREAENNEKEIAVKSKELDLMRVKVDNEAEERKAFMALLTKLVTEKKTE